MIEADRPIIGLRKINNSNLSYMVTPAGKKFRQNRDFTKYSFFPNCVDKILATYFFKV